MVLHLLTDLSDAMCHWKEEKGFLQSLNMLVRGEYHKTSLNTYTELTVTKRYFPNGLIISMVAIYPAYFRWGHASRLIQYAKDLSKIDGTQIGVVSVPNGRALVEHLGFKVHEVYHVQADDELDAPQEVDIAASTFDDNVSNRCEL